MLTGNCTDSNDANWQEEALGIVCDHACIRMHAELVTRKYTYLMKLRETVCANAGCSQSIMQRLHQIAPALLIWHMLH